MAVDGEDAFCQVYGRLFRDEPSQSTHKAISGLHVMFPELVAYHPSPSDRQTDLRASSPLLIRSPSSPEATRPSDLYG